MMPQQDENMNNIINMMQQQQPLQAAKKHDYSHITKHPYLNKVFCWIQSGNTQEVKRFFDTFPHLLKDFNSPNKWNPFLYAARYGNIQLMEYFHEKRYIDRNNQQRMETMTSGILSSYSIVHTAIYSGEESVLDFVLKKMDVKVNPTNCQISPLKVAMKANNPKMVELLVAKGAYYLFGDVYNNIYQRPNVDEQNKYLTLQGGRDITQQMVVQQSIIRDCPIKETLKFARVKSIVAMKLLGEKQRANNKHSKFSALSNILARDQYYNLLLRMAVNKGQSILSEGGKQNATVVQNIQQIG